MAGMKKPRGKPDRDEDDDYEDRPQKKKKKKNKQSSGVPAPLIYGGIGALIVVVVVVVLIIALRRPSGGGPGGGGNAGDPAAGIEYEAEITDKKPHERVVQMRSGTSYRFLAQTPTTSARLTIYDPNSQKMGTQLNFHNYYFVPPQPGAYRVVLSTGTLAPSEVVRVKVVEAPVEAPATPDEKGTHGPSKSFKLGALASTEFEVTLELDRPKRSEFQVQCKSMATDFKVRIEVKGGKVVHERLATGLHLHLIHAKPGEKYLVHVMNLGNAADFQFRTVIFPR